MILENWCISITFLSDVVFRKKDGLISTLCEKAEVLQLLALIVINLKKQTQKEPVYSLKKETTAVKVQ